MNNQHILWQDKESLGHKQAMANYDYDDHDVDDHHDDIDAEYHKTADPGVG